MKAFHVKLILFLFFINFIPTYGTTPRTMKYVFSTRPSICAEDGTDLRIDPASLTTDERQRYIDFAYEIITNKINEDKTNEDMIGRQRNIDIVYEKITKEGRTKENTTIDLTEKSIVVNSC